MNNDKQRFQRGRNFQPPEKHRINMRISAREVRVVTDEGEQLGVLPIRNALQAAEERGLDLVEISPQAQPPVCKIMDYGKFKYREQKKEQSSKKNRSETQIKELRVRYSTSTNDFETKLKHAREFLEEGDKVKFSMRFHGREAMYLNLGKAKLDMITERLKDIAKIDESSPLYGKQIYIVYSPLK